MLFLNRLFCGFCGLDKPVFLMGYFLCSLLNFFFYSSNIIKYGHFNVHLLYALVLWLVQSFILNSHVTGKGEEKIDAQGHNVSIYTFQIYQHFRGFVVKSLLFYRASQWKQVLKFQICCLIWRPRGFLKCLSFSWYVDHLFVELFSGSLITVGLGNTVS